MASDMKVGQAIGMVFGGTLGFGIGAWLTYASWTGRIGGFVSFLPLPVVALLVVVAGVTILGIGAHGLLQLSRAAARRPRKPTGPGLLIATVVLGVIGFAFAGYWVLTGAGVWFAGLLFPTLFTPPVWVALWCAFRD